MLVSGSLTQDWYFLMAFLLSRMTTYFRLILHVLVLDYLSSPILVEVLSTILVLDSAILPISPDCFEWEMVFRDHNMGTKGRQLPVSWSLFLDLFDGLHTYLPLPPLKSILPLPAPFLTYWKREWLVPHLTYDYPVPTASCTMGETIIIKKKRHRSSEGMWTQTHFKVRVSIRINVRAGNYLHW